MQTIEQYREKRKAWYEANKDKVKEYNKAWRNANKDKVKEYNRRYYEKLKNQENANHEEKTN